MIQRLPMLALASLLLSSCDGGVDSDSAPGPDTTLRSHFVEPSTPTPEGLAYIEAIAQVHVRADQAEDPDDQVRELRRGLALPVPGGLGEAEVLRLELAARMAEILSQQPQGVPVARDLLTSMLRTEHSLPVDRATARALIALGDIAEQSGDDALAAGSYMRAIRVLSLLRQELEQ